MKLLILTRYPTKGPSSRYRFLQYLADFERAGFQFEVQPFFSDLYLDQMWGGRAISKLHVLGRYCRRLLTCLRAKRFDAVWLEGEMLPLLPALVERGLYHLLPRARFYDFDDAVWLRYRNKPLLAEKYHALLRDARGVVVGNPWLERYVHEVNPNTLLVPTVVDWNKYADAQAPLSGHTIGWIGSPNTLFFMENLYPGLADLRRRQNFDIHIVGAESHHEALDIRCSPWREEDEVGFIERFDVGVMPLERTEWAEGKCGLKMIQYMAAGVPAIASPVGVNQQYVTESGGGLLAENDAEWQKQLDKLLADQDLRREMGHAGRVYVQQNLTVAVQAPRLIDFFKQKVG